LQGKKELEMSEDSQKPDNSGKIVVILIGLLLGAMTLANLFNIGGSSAPEFKVLDPARSQAVREAIENAHIEAVKEGRTLTTEQVERIAEEAFLRNR